ncbi:helix-turn-helix transcriptional regulator [Micromonospora sp. NPDC023888]|uniref:helix-turn-helix domain-containing protein n=1 Tax=Micromonospora sp. NPDC023888 TaxID=3155607 RepID=UPI0033C6F825
MSAGIGRPEKPLDPAAGPVAQFAYSLRRLRHEVGSPSYRTLANRTYYSVSALSIAASGTRFPSWACAEAYVRACGVGGDDIVHWHRRWSAVDEHVRAQRRAQRQAAKNRPAVAVLEVADVPLVSPAPLPVLELRYIDADPALVATLEEFLTALDQMRIEKGLSLRQIAERSRLTNLPRTTVSGGLSRSQLHDMLNGKAPLRPRQVGAYLLACGIPQTRALTWLTRLNQLVEHDRRAKAALAALKANSTETIPATAVVSTPPNNTKNVGIEETVEPGQRGKHRRSKRWTTLIRQVLIGPKRARSRHDPAAVRPARAPVPGAPRGVSGTQNLSAPTPEAAETSRP